MRRIWRERLNPLGTAKCVPWQKIRTYNGSGPLRARLALAHYRLCLVIGARTGLFGIGCEHDRFVMENLLPRLILNGDSLGKLSGPRPLTTRVSGQKSFLSESHADIVSKYEQGVQWLVERISKRRSVVARHDMTFETFPKIVRQQGFSKAWLQPNNRFQTTLVLNQDASGRVRWAAGFFRKKNSS